MASASGTPVPRIPGIERGRRAAFVQAPPAVVLGFARDLAGLCRRLTSAAGRLAPAGSPWTRRPTRASGVPIGRAEDVVREVGLAAGRVDHGVRAIEGTGSRLRFVVPEGDRSR